MSTTSVTYPNITLIRRGALGAFVAGLALAASGIIQLILVYPTPGPGELGSTSAYLIESAHAIAWAGMILAFFGLRALHGKKFGRLGNLGFYLGSIGYVSAIVITIGILVATALGTSEDVFAAGSIGETIANLMILPGFLTMLVWIPLMGIAVWRANILPRWCAVLLIAHPVFVIFLLASYGFGGIVLGALWFFVGLGLWSYNLRQEVPGALSQRQTA